MWGAARPSAAFACLCAAALAGGAVAAATPARVALVVGVSHYQAVRPLKNTVPDAELVGDALKRLGFEVTRLVDPERKDLTAALDAFARRADGADAAVIYFAGHGAEIAGVNYLFPRDASNASVEGMMASGLEATRVRAAALHATHIRLLILDACRDNPAESQSIEIKPGLARETGGLTSQVVTLMAAAPGQAAQDGTDHSPFAKALTAALQRPTVTAGEIPRLVQSEVQRATHDQQSPDLQGIWVDIYWRFDGRSAARGKSDAADLDAKTRSAREQSFWQTIQNSSDPADFQAYLDQSDRGEFSGLYRPLALNRIGALAHPGAGASRSTAARPLPVGTPPAAVPAMTDARAAFQRGDYPAAIAAWRGAAAKGAVAAQYDLGVMAFTGRGGPKDLAAAADWFRQGAQGGHPGAMANYGLSLLNGFGVAKDVREGARWIRASADAGLPYGMGLLGQLCLQGLGAPKDAHQGAAWIARAADAGDGASMVDLGGLYERGEGVARSRQAALAAYQRAANAGQGAAMVRLGYAYEDGDLVARDPIQAATWYQRAAEAGDAEGMSALGVMFENGRGVPRDYARAADSFRQASNRGDPRGLLGLGSLYAEGQGVTHDDVTAAQLFQRAADAGSAAAMRNLAVMYESGRGVARDRATAITLYRRAAAAGDSAAASDLARLGG